MNNILEMKQIVKQYTGVTALNNVDFSVNNNSVHCVVGENGAGKSTLIKIITCVEKMTKGQILFNGRPFAANTVKDAMDCGISTVFQELNIVDQLTVAENLVLGRETHKYGIISKKTMYPVYGLMQEFAKDIPLHKTVAELSFAEKQIVEIVKAIGFEAKLIILDEPTAALAKNESERLYDVIQKLKKRGLSIIYISHILDDIFTVGDEVTVLRDGLVVGTKTIQNTTREELVQMMIGKISYSNYIKNSIDQNKVAMEAKNLSTSSIKNISFNIYKGEIVGFYGLRGSGKSETARALYGVDKLHDGQIYINGKKAAISNPKKAMKHGLAMVPEERLSEGLIMKLSISDNISISNLRKVVKNFMVSEKLKDIIARHFIDALSIKSFHERQLAGTLSGGNQQKVVVAKCLNADTTILMLDEPSRGIDVGAKEEIYAIMRKLAAEGTSILVFSSEYDEIEKLCDRVHLIVKGRIGKTINHEDLDPQKVRMITMGQEV